ncbi:jg2009 [Pararge aegeria aegeria]|uniref:Jg2009 protein n=1 Tax=Pararge aegeria aegeria TaxID=348720 RepID=A0A8S4SFD4_9NEOP|nr:jg2009 [Pararge aegeria aegeria]
MGRAHSSEKGWTLGSQGAGMAAPYCNTFFTMRCAQRDLARPLVSQFESLCVHRGKPGGCQMTALGKLTAEP